MLKNRFISLVVAIIIVAVIILFNIPRPSSNEVLELERINIKINSQIDSIKRKLYNSNITRDVYRQELNKRISKGDSLDSILIVKNKQLAKKDRYINLAKDSIKKLVEFRAQMDGFKIEKVDQWCLEKDDSVQNLKDILITKDDIINNEGKKIIILNKEVETYKNDSTDYNNIIAGKDTIINNKEAIIIAKDKEIKPLKKENKILKGVAIILTIIALL